jgi:REP element-mobilizing transposase RayT
LGFQFAWQRNYYEHIIRNQNTYEQIPEYILNNPLKWDADKFNSLDIKNNNNQ